MLGGVVFGRLFSRSSRSVGGEFPCEWIENRTQILTGFTNDPAEAAKAHLEKRAPVWDSL